MGAWGISPFDNDDAADFLNEVEEAPLRSVNRALRAITRAAPGTYLDVDTGAAGWAACELVAMAFGQRGRAVANDQVLDLAARLRPRQEHRRLALEALARIAGPKSSELADLWHEGKNGARWDKALADLASRLRAANAGTLKAPKPKAAAKRPIKRQRRTLGDIVEIDLGQEFMAYARVLEEGLFAFYDSRARQPLAMDDITARAVLFIVPVMAYAVTRARWKVVGNAPLDDTLQNPPPLFWQDVLDPDSFKLYDKGKFRPATREQCMGLERLAVWDPEHVEDRLRDHYLGRPNDSVESLKIKPGRDQPSKRRPGKRPRT